MTSTATAAPAKDEAHLRLLAGRVRAIETMPYLSSALMVMVPTRSKALPTLAVDKRWRMYWNPDFVQSLSVEECAGAWLHEVGHLLREHSSRWEALSEPNERHRLWNCAGDAAINADLKDAKVVLPRIKAVLPERIPGAQRNHTTEQMYRLLLNSPAGQKIKAKQPEIAIMPRALRYDYPKTTIVVLTRDTVIDATVTVAVTDVNGAAVATSGINAISDRQMTFDLDPGAAPGPAQVVVTTPNGDLSAELNIVAPSIKMRPDHIERGYTAPFNTVIEGSATKFDDTAIVTLSDSDGAEVTGAVTGVTVINAGLIRFDLPLLADGVYTVTVACNGETCTAALPVGVPFLDLTPEGLPVGHGTPFPIAAIGSDIVFDASTTVEIHPTSMLGPFPPANAIGNVTVTSATTLNFDVTATLDEGAYLIVATGNGGTEQAVAPFTVSAGEGSGEGDGGGEGDEDSDGDGESEGKGKGKGGKGKGQSDGDGTDPDEVDDCGSGGSGGTRPWDKDDSENNDGSIDEGRAMNVRQNVAKEIERASRERGDVPAGLSRWAQNFLNPAVDWRKELNAVVRRTAATVAGRRDYSMARPSRRASVTPGFILPSMRAPRPPAVDLVVDTSGSMGTNDLAQVVAEIGALVTQVSKRGSMLRVRSCDASSAEAAVIRDVSNVVLVGGGGTDMRVGIKAAAEARPKSDLIITLTDGETPWPEEPDPANPGARYVAVLVRGEAHYSEVPPWMHKIVIDPATLGETSGRR